MLYLFFFLGLFLLLIFGLLEHSKLHFFHATDLIVIIAGRCLQEGSGQVVGGASLGSGGC
jgi:hypothetical protein